MLPEKQPAREEVKPEQTHEEGPQPWPTAACWPVCRSHDGTSRLVCHWLTTPETWLKNGTKCGLTSVSTHFQTLTESSLGVFCSPSGCPSHADPPAGCTDTLMLKLIRAALRFPRVYVRRCT